MESLTRKQILDALGAFQKDSVLSLTTDEIADTLADESDRGMIVVMGSLTEDMLLERVCEQLPGLTKSLRKDLTRSGGLLATWADRTNMALALGVIDEHDAELLEVLKSMRNACAHSRRHIDLRTPELLNALSLMFDARTAEAVRASSQPDLLRTLAFLSASYLWGRLRGETPDQSSGRVERMFEEFHSDALREAWLRRQKRRGPRETDDDSRAEKRGPSVDAG